MTGGCGSRIETHTDVEVWRTKVDFNRLTQKAQDAFRAAQSIALRFSHQQIEPEHLLLALIEQQGGLVPAILERADLKVQTVKHRLEEEIAKIPKVSGSGPGLDQVYISARLNKIYLKAEDEAKQLKDDYISVEHFLLAPPQVVDAQALGLASIGVRLIETKPDIRIAAAMVTENSCSSRPTMPPMKRTGTNTVASDSVIDRIVNATSREPSSDACHADLPISMWRTMFSSMTIASSTTKPTASVRAISVRLFTL